MTTSLSSGALLKLAEKYMVEKKEEKIMNRPKKTRNLSTHLLIFTFMSFEPNQQSDGQNI